MSYLTFATIYANLRTGEATTTIHSTNKFGHTTLIDTLPGTVSRTEAREWRDLIAPKSSILIK